MKSWMNHLGTWWLCAALIAVSPFAVSAQEGASTSPAVEEEGEEGEAPAGRRRPIVVETIKWSPAEDQVVSLVYSNQLRVTAPDYASVEKAKPGEIVPLTQCAAPKLKTDIDLQFPGVLIETENVAENYPGVYSLWLKRTADGWNLVFNWKADVFGTMHDPEADTAEVPLDYEYREAEAQSIATLLIEADADEDEEDAKKDGKKDVPRFKTTFTEKDGTVHVNIEWGAHHWSTNFKAA